MKEANTLLQTNGNEIQLDAGEIYCGTIDDCQTLVQQNIARWDSNLLQ